MKYICLGYIESDLWEHMSDAERTSFMDECFVYDDELRRNGHFVGGEALQSPENAVTLRVRKGKLSVTDGPFAETKEYLGGIMILEATDLNRAISLMSKHPSIRMGGTFEVRPSADLTELAEESRKRRAR